ncbi:MAG TPA: ATP-dependent DNA ligase [Woeseiaceae bacterium]|nr:ATP-dependent DNA ligase [Woeseiaceae bacterium]
MQFSDLVNVSREVAATRSRLKKRALIAATLRRAAAGEIALAVNYLGGTLPQGRIGLGPAVVRDALASPPAVAPSLTLADVDAAVARIAGHAGKGSQAARRADLLALFGRATEAERDFLARLVQGEIRQGALEGVLVEAIADAAGVAVDAVRRAVMLAADPAPVAAAALAQGERGLRKFRLELMSPVRPMLAQPAADIDAAMQQLGEAVLDYKLDGARVQIHRAGDDVRIFSRGLNDVTERLPEVVAATLALPARQLVLDGEVIALKDGRPLPFQVTMRRFGRTSDVAAQREALPLDIFLFDVLHAEGDDLLDIPLRERAAILADLAPATMRVERRLTDEPGAAAAFLAAAFEAGHEGIMAKAPGSPYAAGSRGAEWLKIKQAHTLDLVVLAAEWGSGRRKGWLSNLHLGARDPATGGFVMLGKTFKGLTDRMLEEQTAALLALETHRAGHVVHVRPAFVVEIAVSDIQQSPQYPAGLALRFARVKAFRPDKPAAEADTIGTVRALYVAQPGVA